MKKVFIVIVSHNGGQKLVKAVNLVKTILKKNKNVNLIIVDNASKDDSIKKIRKIIHSLRLFQNKTNLGFAKAANQGVRFAIKHEAERILLINQDAFIKNKDFWVLVENQNNIVSPIIKFKRNSRFVYDLGGKLDWRIVRPYHLEKLIKPNEISDIDYVSGCCMLIDTLVFKKIGYFDENFFLYFEDVDFCLRASKAGLYVGVEQNAIVLHDFVEKDQKSIRAVYHLIKSHLIFINKWAQFSNRAIAYFYWFLISLKIVLNKLIHVII